jgi:hypothetical protein
MHRTCLVRRAPSHKLAQPIWMRPRKRLARVALRPVRGRRKSEHVGSRPRHQVCHRIPSDRSASMDHRLSRWRINTRFLQGLLSVSPAYQPIRLTGLAGMRPPFGGRLVKSYSHCGVWTVASRGRGMDTVQTAMAGKNLIGKAAFGSIGIAFIGRFD